MRRVNRHHGQNALLAVVALVAIALAAWLLSSRSEPGVARRPPSPTAPTADDAHAARANPPGTEPSPREAATNQAVAPAPASSGAVLRVRLRGLHADVPWTTPLQLNLENRDEAGDRWLEHDGRAAVAADGASAFPLPDWWATTTPHDGRVSARDPNYLALEHRWRGAVDTTNELVLDVQVVALLEGRVVDTAGNPVPGARVDAFTIRDGVPIDEMVGMAGTRLDGRWRMKAPPAVPVLLVAQPLATGGGRRVLTTEDGGLHPLGDRPHDALLPASVRAQGSLGALTKAPDIVLPAAARMRGTVRWNDRSPIHRAVVRVLARDGTTLRATERYAVHLHTDGAASPLVEIETESDGAFTLPAVPGAAVEVALVALPTARLVGDTPVRSAVPPQEIEIVLPPPVALRVRAAGRAVPQARVEFDGHGANDTDMDGGLDVVAMTPLRVRASSGPLQSQWLDVAPAAAGSTVTIELRPVRIPTSIEFDGEFRVRNCVVEWRSADGRTGREHLLRDDRGGPFELFLLPGQYRLRIGPGGGEANGVFLLPSERDVEVTGDPVRIVVPATFGGSFAVIATDSSGRCPGARCEVHDSSGADVTDCFTLDGTRGARGELMPGGANTFARILPPGDYEVLFDFGQLGARRTVVAVRPREVTDVRVRL